MKSPKENTNDIKMEVTLIEDRSTQNPDETTILAARGDQADGAMTNSAFVEDKLRGIDNQEFIEGMLRKGHFGPFEHPQAFFAVKGVSRVAMAQITRHRQMSWDVQSQRAVDFSNKNPVIPDSFYDDDRRFPAVWEDKLEEHWEESVNWYTEAIEDGVPKEDARFFLPQATPVNLTFSANARSLMHFLDMRKSGAAQWEAQEFAEAVLEEAKEWAPLTFEGYEEYVNNASLRAP